MASELSDTPEHLLPWYLNGTLGQEERAAVENWIASDPSAASELAFMGEVAGGLRAEHKGYDESGTLSRLLRMTAEASEQPAAVRPAPKPAGNSSWLEKFFGMFEPKFAMACLLVFAQAGIIAMLLSRQDTDYSDVRSPSAAMPAYQGPVLRVTFQADASEQEIRTLLVATGAQIVSGPTQLGDYFLAPPNDDERLAQFKRSSIVDSVEKLPQLPADAVPQ